MGRDRAVGVDLGGTKILAGVVGADGAIVRRVERPTPLGPAEAIVAAVGDAVAEVVADDVAAIGLGVPAALDPVSRLALHATNLPIAGVDVAGAIHDRFGLPAAIENDANAAALAEWRFGAGAGARDLVMLTLGTGVGGGLVLAGQPYRGWAELGHVVLDADGPPCQGSCRGRGHLEVLVSGSAADAAAARLYGDGADARTLIERAREGDAAALGELDRMGHLLGLAIGSFVNVFFPGVVVVGGGFGAAAGDLLLGPARAAARREAIPPAGGRVRIVPAALGADAGLVGAGLVGLAEPGGGG